MTRMYDSKLASVYILFATSVCVRCSYWQKMWPLDDNDGGSGDYHGVNDRYNHGVPIDIALPSNCDTAKRNTLAEIKSEIQNLQQLVVGLRQKLDPDSKLSPPPESKCPPGFQYVDHARSCYKVVYEEHNWTLAGQRCHDFHPEAHLAVITKNIENFGLTTYLRPEIAKNSHRVGWWGDGAILWASGQRLNENSCTSEFVWKLPNSTQLPLSFTYWDRKEPNCHNNKLEGCLQLRSFFGFKWNDASCDAAVYPLCEYDPL